MRIILVDERISDSIERSLYKLGTRPIRLPSDLCLGEAVKSHPDTLIFHHGGTLITTADYCDAAAYIFSDIREMTEDVKICFTADVRGSKYPHDCPMNGLVIGNRLFCNQSHISKAIIEYATENGLKIINTNQGYPACTTLAFGNNAITADQGMAKVMKNEGVSVLTISQGHISLPPHEYGFIGGASVVVGNKVCFYGDVSRHPDREAIMTFIRENGYEPISLSDEPLVDFGGGIVL